MERGNLKTITQKLKKYQYPALILLVGAVLLLWPSGKAEESPPREEPLAVIAPEQTMEAQMEAILSCIDGAGEVRVLLTKRTGDETIYQTDRSASASTDGASSSTDTTVMANVSGGGEAPVVRQTVYGQYQGALIVCQGADHASVKLELVNAVAGLTGLSADRITVIKMKS